VVTNRTPIGRPAQTRITAEAIEIFRRLRAAKGEECHELGWQLHAELHMRPWETRVADASTAKRPSWLHGEMMAAKTWDAARALWVELDAALAAERRAISSTDATTAPPPDDAA
jgi:hypothetical protein